MARFKLHFNTCIPYIISVLLMFGCSSTTHSRLKSESYVVLADEDKNTEKWGTYLYAHFKNRVADSAFVLFNDHQNQGTQFSIEVDTNIAFNYCIDVDKNKIHFKVNNDKTALWICYQLIENIGQQDARVDVNDLPPATISIKEGCHNFDFEYREIHTQANVHPDNSGILGNHNLEIDWAIWGHNLYKIIQKSEITNPSIYALVGQERNHDQLCFSSEKLLELTTSYIIDNFGYGDEASYHFMMMPNDNMISCTCETCMQLGNTQTNATPAVTFFLNQLSAQFPKHQFYTTAYATTETPPPTPLAKNCGVFLSTIHLPKGIEPDKNNKNTKEFVKQINAWRKASSNIYLWDYSSNFDDYLTPLPILTSIQKQLQFFKKLGIKGIFYNDSGYDYASFGEVKTYTISALMKDVNLNIESLISNFFKKNYPKNHNTLFQYYIGLETEYAQNKIPFSMYGGFEESSKSYFNKETFIPFYNDLIRMLPEAKGQEKQKLQELLTALSYTRLQVAYYNREKENGFLTKKDNKTLVVFPELEVILNRLKDNQPFIINRLVN